MEKEEKGFNVELVIKYATDLLRKYEETKDLMFEEFFQILSQFCRAFKLINTFLGIAFSDVTDKVRIMGENNQRFPGHPGFLSFVKMEMELKIIQYNGGNNKELNAPKEYRHYDSTGRNLLRMMWLLTFIRVTFEGLRDIKADMSDILCQAYDSAFGEKHSWIVRNGAKLAIKASSNRKEFVEVISGKKYDEEYFRELSNQFMEKFVPIH